MPPTPSQRGLIPTRDVPSAARTGGSSLRRGLGVATLWLLTCVLSLSAHSAPEPRHRGGARHLSDPSELAPHDVYRQYLRRHRTRLGMGEADIAGLEVAAQHRSRRTGTTYLYMRQFRNGRPVIGTEVSASVDRRGRLVHVGGQPAWNVTGRAADDHPQLGPVPALRAIARHLGVTLGPVPHLPKSAPGPRNTTTFDVPRLSRDPVTLSLIYFLTDDGALHLAWNAVVRPPSGAHWWNVYLDARSGELLARIDWVADQRYRVYPYPERSPLHGEHTVVQSPADPLASPAGWHDTNEAAGAEFTDTRGNAAWVQEDLDANDAAGARPDGGTELNFDFPIDLGRHPSSYRAASSTNLFYWTNFLHDVFYHYGFDEAAGNFQTNNHGRGGTGGDAVRADVHDGADLDNPAFRNNARFASPPDGTAPRMEMLLFVRGPGPGVRITAPSASARELLAAGATFGKESSATSAVVVAALDAANVAGPTTTDACTELANADQVAGKIALVDRGECLFIEKVANVQAAGGVGVIVANNAGDELIGAMAGEDANLAIPAVFIGQGDGSALRAELDASPRAVITTDRHRDSALDNEVVIHEYVHGLTTRLTGGRHDSDCLNAVQSAGLGEGWSDWFALALTTTAADGPLDSRTIGTFSLRQGIGGPGFRNEPYSRDMGTSPHTFADIDDLNRPHGVGEVWAATLWDLFWVFVDQYGFDSNPHAGTGGNNRLMQLVIDALKLQACNPTFLEARDALLAADLDDNGGIHQCLIWETFARRGMGSSASGERPGNTQVSEAFDLPLACQQQCGNASLDLGEQCDDANQASFDGCSARCRLETHLPAITGTANGGLLSLRTQGVDLEVPVSAGTSAADAGAALAAAINAHTVLDAFGVKAHAAGSAVSVDGEVETFAILDLGLDRTSPMRTFAGQAQFQPGLNLVGLASLSEAGTLGAALEALAAQAPITSIDAIDAGAGRSCALAPNGSALGAACTTPVDSSRGYQVIASGPGASAHHTPVPCPDYEFGPGPSLVAFPCASPQLTARDLLASTPASVVGRFDANAGRWRHTIGAQTHFGPDFPIAPTTAYLLGTDTQFSLRGPSATPGLDRGVHVGQTQVLDGTASQSPQGRPLAYRWTLSERPSTSTATLDNPTSPTPHLTPDVAGTYRLTLQTDDGILTSAPTTLTLYAFAALPP